MQILRAGCALACSLLALTTEAAWPATDGRPTWSPVPYPVPLSSDAGRPEDDAERLARFEVRDDLILPDGFRADIVALGGQRFGAAGHEILTGTGADYAGLVPRRGHPGEFLCVWNHEYVSARPWLQSAREVHGVDLAPSGHVARARLSGLRIDLQDPRVLEQTDPLLIDGLRRLCRTAMSDVGFSILHLRRTDAGGLAVITNSTLHRRVFAHGRVNIDPATPLVLTGPASALGIALTGSLQNCSGQTTPWGTVLTCEENFQSEVTDQVDARGGVPEGARRVFEAVDERSATGLPFEFLGLAQGLDVPPDPRGYGWVCEVDPETGAVWKHSLLGRFRHENVALRCVTGRPLVAYMGDDRRGGHVWKYASRGIVRDPADPGNRRLFEDGHLEVAQFQPGGTGRWIPFDVDTPLQRPAPEHRADGLLWLPRRPAGGMVAVGAEGMAGRELTPAQWVSQIEHFAGRPFEQLRLGDLVEGTNQLGVLLLDAYLMANACGATPTARPEDVELHPFDGALYMAFSDATGSDDGSPDRRIFPDCQRDTSRQYGGIYQLDDERGDRPGSAFLWRRWSGAGEAPEGGGGFACPDNIAFDDAGNLWFCTDISTLSQNLPVTREGDSAPGGKHFPGLFGNNALFMVPTRGPSIARPSVFATAPMESELTGIAFALDGDLLLSIQHPGEDNGARRHPDVRQPERIRERELQCVDRAGRPFVQRRDVPLGSNFPSGRPGAVPRPALLLVRPVARNP